MGRRLRLALVAMVRGKGKYSDRVDAATSELDALVENDFPQEFRADAKLLLGMREKGRKDVGAGCVYWNFDGLSPRERDEWTDLLIRMYSRYHQDVGRHTPELADIA